MRNACGSAGRVTGLVGSDGRLVGGQCDGPEDVVVSWISQGAAGLTTASQEVVGYPRDGSGATEAGAAGCLGMSRDSWVGSGRLAGGARYRGDCGTSRYVA